jgi:predicted lipoprotein with Yx(FWY)xxD motif
MHSKVLLSGGLAAIALLAAACGGASQSAATSSFSPSSPATSVSPSSSAAPVVNAAITLTMANNPKLGQILVDSSGRTVYLFLADKGPTSVCYTQCAAYWPPVITHGALKAGAGVNASLLGTTARTDGTTEVTYAGHPLYYFISDKKPGDVTGQGVNGFGAPWYVVAPSGMQVG